MKRDAMLLTIGWILCFAGVLLAALLFACGHGCPAAQRPGSQPDHSPACPRR